MIRTIEIGNKEVRLSNNIGWTMIYKDQFGHDIVSTLTPMLAAGLDLISGFLSDVDTSKPVDAVDLLKKIDGDVLIDAMAHLSGVEIVDLINITWAMAKAMDDDIPEPKRWVRDFEEFPIDVIAPEIAKLAFKGMVSTKNLKRLMSLKEKIRTIQPLTSTQSSSPELSEA